MQTTNHSERRDAMDNFLYYAFALAALVIGIVVLKKVATCIIKMVVDLFILKKVATCMIKMAVGVIMIAVLFAIYRLYLS